METIIPLALLVLLLTYYRHWYNTDHKKWYNSQWNKIGDIEEVEPEKQCGEVENIDCDINEFCERYRDKERRDSQKFDEINKKHEKLLMPLYIKLDELYVSLNYHFEKKLNHGKLKLIFEDNWSKKDITVSIHNYEHEHEFCVSQICYYIKGPVAKKYKYTYMGKESSFETYEETVEYIVKLYLRYIHTNY